MAVQTLHIKWRYNTPNKSHARIMGLVRDFLVSNGWTLLTDAIASNYFVVTYDRQTGFVGDNPIVMIVSSGSSYMYCRALEKWDPATNTATNYASEPAPGNNVWYFSPTYDTDLYISCDSTFILGFSNVVNGGGYGVYPLCGVTCMERLPGDTDLGTFYGQFNSWCFSRSYTGRFYVPKRFDGSTGSYYAVNHRTGIPVGFQALDEANRHVVFDFIPGAHEYGRVKGPLYGAAQTTYSLDLPTTMLLPDATTPKWMVSQYEWADLSYTPLMAVGPITVVS